MNVAMMATLMSASNSKFELAVHVTKNRPRAPCRMAVQPQPGLQGWGPVGDRDKKNRCCEPGVPVVTPKILSRSQF